MATGSVNESAYQFAADEDCVREVNVENTYDHVQACGKKVSSENESKKRSKSQTIIKVAILSTILVLLFGLALCGVLLVSKEKLRVDETKSENLEIRADMRREQQEANTTWMEKITAMELQMKNTSEKFQLMLHNQKIQQNDKHKKLLADMKRQQLKANSTWMKKMSAVELQMKNMQTEQLKVNSTWMEKIATMKLQMQNASEKFQLMLHDQNLTYQKLIAESVDFLTKMILAREAVQNSTQKKLFDGITTKVSNLKTTLERKITQSTESWKLRMNELSLARDGITKELNYLLADNGWHKASNGFYYKISYYLKNYENAKQQCQLIGARLASKGLRNIEVRRELVEFMKTKGGHVWIGANDKKNEGTFVWEDGETSSGTDIDWGESPITAGENNDCVYYDEILRQAKAILCNKRFKYMCEKEI